jgi:hypothetical protein
VGGEPSMKRISTILLVAFAAVVACSTPWPAVVDEDAGPSEDATVASDSGSDAGHDASDDAGGGFDASANCGTPGLPCCAHACTTGCCDGPTQLCAVTCGVTCGGDDGGLDASDASLDAGD